MVFQFNAEAASGYSTDLHYDLFTGGYIRPEEMLSDPKQLEALREAMNIVDDFLEQAQEAGLVEQG